jgi:hypothetical protein
MDASRDAQRQSTPTVMMIRPVRFQSNPQTADSNSFQNLDQAPAPPVAQQGASEEFDALVAALEAADVEVIAFDGVAEPHSPDQLFPNNWVSFHSDGTVVLYPMLAENRRTERRMDVIEALDQHHGFDIVEIIDLSRFERKGRFLEATGSICMDRANRIAYACLSPRTDSDLLDRFARRLGYEPLPFRATGRSGRPIYHTNVMMCIGERFALICADAIDDAGERRRVLGSLESTGHRLITIDHAQMAEFAGNMLEIENRAGGKILAMSTRAEAALGREQRSELEAQARIVSACIDTIENSAGGSVRCMLAEIHLPRRKAGTS